MFDTVDELSCEEPPALVIGETGLLTSIARTGIPVILGHELNSSPALRSKYARLKVHLSPYESDAFIRELIVLGKKLKRKPVIFSDDDRALLNISRNRSRLGEYYSFLYPDADLVEKILDKKSFARLSDRHGLPVPRTYQIHSKDDIRHIIHKMSFPCIIKPAQRHYWWGSSFVDVVGFYKKALRCPTPEEFVHTYNLVSKINPSVVIQEYVHGEDDQHYSANVFADRDGKILGFYIARKMRIYPVEAGTGTYIKTVRNPEVKRLSFEIISRLGLKGLLNIQFKRDSRTGEYKLLEIHIRNSLWSRLGCKAGADLANICYRYLTAGTIPEEVVTAKPGIKYFNMSHDILAAIQYRRDKKLSLFGWLSSLRGDRVFAISSIEDPMPVVYKIGLTVKNRVNTICRRQFQKLQKKYRSVSAPATEALQTEKLPEAAERRINESEKSVDYENTGSADRVTVNRAAADHDRKSAERKISGLDGEDTEHKTSFDRPKDAG